MKEFLVGLVILALGIAVVVKLVLDVFEYIVSILDLVSSLHVTLRIILPSLLESHDIPLKAEHGIVVNALPECLHLLPGGNRLALVPKRPMKRDLLLKNDQAPLPIVLLLEQVALLRLQALQLLFKLESEPGSATGLVALDHVGVGLTAVSDEVVFLLLEHGQVVLDLGVVPDVRMLVHREQVDQQAVDQEAKREAKE